MTRIVPDIEQDSPLWDGLPEAETVVSRALEAAAAGCQTALQAGAGVSVLLTDDAHMREINRDWRKQDKPTNVLSFPAVEPRRIASSPFLGDIAIAFETVEREARDEGKAVHDHLAHLAVHGFLHLVGFDHMTDAEADAMEGREIAILADLGIANPYADTVPESSGPVRAAS
ncbi:rRNA maturation RNase YbeY [uncultured Alsobacter sp.]|uniref:rRNA maturation RNase YbeY n=1 Tax=uncultured Alsobacter sp. TaxID=1748258 RepID=UPI0025F5F988|nr:rRNA maturation RNase YbeY [uncultured Alsobacter sp.]